MFGDYLGTNGKVVPKIKIMRGLQQDQTREHYS